MMNDMFMYRIAKLIINVNVNDECDEENDAFMIATLCVWFRYKLMVTDRPTIRQTEPLVEVRWRT